MGLYVHLRDKRHDQHFIQGEQLSKCLTPTKLNRVAVEGFIPRHNVTTYLHAKVAILQIRKHIHNIYNNITREAVVLYMYDPMPNHPSHICP